MLLRAVWFGCAADQTPTVWFPEASASPSDDAHWLGAVPGGLRAEVLKGKPPGTGGCESHRKEGPVLTCLEVRMSALTCLTAHSVPHSLCIPLLSPRQWCSHTTTTTADRLPLLPCSKLSGSPQVNAGPVQRADVDLTLLPVSIVSSGVPSDPRGDRRGGLRHPLDPRPGRPSARRLPVPPPLLPADLARHQAAGVHQ